MMGTKIKDLTTGASPADTDYVLWGKNDTAGLAYKMSFAQLKAKLDSMTGGGGGDTTPPTVTVKNVANSTPNKIDVTFSESVTVTTAGWSAKKNGTAWTISSVTGSGTNWTFTMATNAASGDTLLISYDSTTGSTLDTSSNELVTFTDSAVTNSISASYDSDAVAFFTAAGITDTTQKNAVNQLVLDLKAASLWSKMIAIYPMVGGSASSHAVNLKTPGTYNITFGGTWTHSATGAKGDGSTAYGDTSYHYPTLVAGSILAVNDYHHSYYNRVTYSSFSEAIMGAPGTHQFEIQFYSTNHIYSQGMGGTAIDYTASDYKKLIVQTRTSSTVHKLFQNGSQVGSTDTTASGVASVSDLPSNNLNLNCENGSPRTKFSAAECAFASMGKGLTDTDVANLTTAVTTYETALSRNV